MECMVQDMLQYKSKIDQLKQERSSLSSTYESNIEKFKGHITDLERENIMLLNEVKKLESQINNKTDGRDRYKLLLERLRMVEGENSSLVLENEQQRGQYEKCLDEIANQVVQALLAQKMLREECLKLQDKVQDLEGQNQQLRVVFQQRMKLIAEGTNQNGGMFIEGSMESLQSIFSEQTSENIPAIPEMSSPPAWLQNRLPGDRQSIMSFAGSTMSTPDIDLELSREQSEFQCRTKIETEFPATPSSPKSKHVSIMERTSDGSTKRSSSTSSLLPPKCGPNRQRTRSTSSLSRARGLTLLSPRSVSLSKDSETLSQSTNEQSSLNQGVATSANQQGSTTSLTYQSSSSLSVPLNQSHPSINNCSSQGQLSQSVSKIPGLSLGKGSDFQTRRNSLKAEYSIRQGSQSPSAAMINSNSKLSQPKKQSTQGSRSSSTSSIGQGQSRLPSATNTRSQSVGSKIPTVSKSGSPPVTTSTAVTKQTKLNITTQKGKTNTDKVTSVQNRIVPPKSPNLRYSGIRTTLKTDVNNKSATKVENAGANTKVHSSVSVSGSTGASLKMVYSITSVSSSKVTESKLSDKKKPALPVRGVKPINHRNESHFPKMGLTTLNHTCPKNNDSTTNVYANISRVPTKSSSSSPQSDKDVNADIGENSTLTKGHYFYDYSDEDSDFRDCEINRPMSTDFSAASTISLDELLDQTLENIETPVDSDFSSNVFLYKPTQESVKEETEIDDKTLESKDIGLNSDRNGRNAKSESGSKVESGLNVAKKDFIKVNEVKNRLSGKPDIVQDTEQCEQRKLQQNMTISQIPGSSLPGYRAKRPKSLILGAKENKFLYCEYGSSSSSDSSEEEWSCKFSYAKNVKEQEIKSKVAKSVQSGEAKVIESPKSSTNRPKESPTSNSKSEKINNLKMSQLPKPASKKPSKIPPPVAAKPKFSVNSKSDARVPRPKSVEICVNSAISYVHTKNCSTYIPENLSSDFSKADSEHCLNFHKSYDKIENSYNSNTTFEEVKVERSGSKDDGYSTMSSDIQPENLEKYSDAFESSTNSNEARNSNLSLSSQNSYSSEDRVSAHGSLGKVKAMKVKFELENHKSPEMSPTKSPPVSPAKSGLKSPKPVLERLSNKFKEAPPTDNSSVSKLPKPKVNKTTAKDVQSKPKSSIPTPRAVNVKKDTSVTKTESKLPTGIKTSQPVSVASETDKSNEIVCVQSETVELSKTFTSTSCSVSGSPLVTMPTDFCTPKVTGSFDYKTHNPLTSTPKSLVDQFEQLTHFPVEFDGIDILREGYDSNSSISDRGSDLTSLHISEDNILSDIPEEKDGYESSVGIHSGNTSISSLPAINVKRSVQQTSHNSASIHQAMIKHHFTTSLRRYWSSCDGIVRATFDSDYEKQKRDRMMADYDELYGGCLNIETLLERSSSESDMFTRGDKPEVILLPRLQRSMSAERLIIDEISVEEKLQEILKHNVMRQISKSVESADKDGETFTSFVELLIQRGHVLESPSPLKEVKGITEIQTPTPTELNKMAVSNCSSKGNNPSSNNFVSEEKSETELPPLGEDQKRFNSQFYSLCNTGSSRSISEKSESTNNTDNLSANGKSGGKVKNIHTCTNADRNCKKCEEERNLREFDDISKQIESLSKTVNQLHRSLTSINSENSDSGSESNEGDVGSPSAIGNKEIDGYHWEEDEFFLSPYGGEIILGDSPFSKTGASCDWINEYAENVESPEDIGGEEAMLEEPEVDFQVEFNRKNKRNSMQNSIITDSLDEEGNFDSHRFISRRLQQEEARLKSEQGSSLRKDEISVPKLMKLESSMNNVIKSRSKCKTVLKEDLRITPEKDVDDTEKMKTVDIFDKMIQYGGSQDSLDDNIGVDNVMCHRLLGKGPVVAKVTSTTRPALDFSSNQFIRYDVPEMQAMAAFDFLNEISSSHTSDQSNLTKMSHDQLSKQEVKNSNLMSQSTTSNESGTSNVKRHRRKLRQRTRKEPKSKICYQGQPKVRKFSSTSADESNDEDLSLSDSLVESCSSHEDVQICNNIVTKSNSKMTYL
ncbi:NCK-associated protein 5 [Mactra antiquata]